MLTSKWRYPTAGCTFVLLASARSTEEGGLQPTHHHSGYSAGRLPFAAVPERSTRHAVNASEATSEYRLLESISWMGVKARRARDAFLSFDHHTWSLA